jgi:hypothetical protein
MTAMKIARGMTIELRARRGLDSEAFIGFNSLRPDLGRAENCARPAERSFENPLNRSETF